MTKGKCMTKWIFAALMISGNVFSSVVFADDVSRQLVGTWKLGSWIVQVIGEGSREPFGPNTTGRMVITPDGYLVNVLVGANRRPAKTVDEKAALLDSLLAYTGKYTVEGDKITVKVDMSSSEIYTGANQDQMRYFKLDGDTLTFRTPEIASAALPGKKVIATVTWLRER